MVSVGAGNFLWARMNFARISLRFCAPNISKKDRKSKNKVFNSSNRVPFFSEKSQIQTYSMSFSLIKGVETSVPEFSGGLPEFRHLHPCTPSSCNAALDSCNLKAVANETQVQMKNKILKVNETERIGWISR